MDTISPYSPYAKIDAFWDAIANERFYGPRPEIDLAPAPDDSFHSWSEGDKLPSLAYEAWREPRLWWVICDVNGIDPFDPSIPVGTRLRLPSLERVALLVLG
jgi:hypothetical protein